ARGLIEEEDVTLPQKPPGHDHLLLISAAELDHRLLDRRRLDVELIHELLGHMRLTAPADPALWLRGDAEVRQRRVHSNRPRQEEAVLFAILRDHPDAGPHGIARLGDAPRLGTPIAEYAPTLRPVRAPDGPQRLRATGADEPGEPENLAAVHLKAHIAHALAAPKPLHAQRNRPDVALHPIERLDARAAHHAPNHLLHRQLKCRARLHHAAVAQDGHAVRDPADLLHAMADVDDAHTLTLQAA